MKLARLALSVAVAAACSSTNAVELASDGSGQVLLYPYYTVERGTNTLVSVENTTGRGKAARVRFLEALNGRPVLALNLYLAPYDVWTAMITADAGGGAKLVVNDISCTVPAIATGIGGAGEQAFQTSGFDGGDGVPADAEASRGVARTREGYVEIIEMGDIDPEYVLTGGVNFLSAVTHNIMIGTPISHEMRNNCAAVRTEWSSATPFPDTGHGMDQTTMDVRGLFATTGGLAGTGTLINVAQGTDYSYDPVALIGFYMDKPPKHTSPYDSAPSLADASPVSTVTIVDPLTGIPADKTDDWANPAAGTLAGIDAVSAVLMRSAVINEFVTNTEIHAGTDWVITLPTKRWYVDLVVNPVRPFSTPFGIGGACERVEASRYNQSGIAPSDLGCCFGILPPKRICWASNVLTFNNSTILGSDSNADVNINVGSYRAGRTGISFPVTLENKSYHWSHAQTPGVANDLAGRKLVNEAAPNHTFEGLPVIGFAVQRYVNDVLPGGVLSNYGGAYAHRYERKVTP